MSFYCGIDVGSLSSEAVIIDQEAEIIASSIIATEAHSTQAAEDALARALNQASLERNQIVRIVATGYGRVSIPFADKAVTEITCHAKGAHHLFPNTHTVIDIGGQDSKVISLGKEGKVVDFAMNDKCAAGTGRFLEVMAAKLGASLDELGELSRQATREVAISSVCTVFAESEVVSLVANNAPREEIIRGLHRAIVNRVWSMVKSVGVTPQVTMSGGVAKNRGVVDLFEDKLGHSINVYQEPQIVGALGAALLAREQKPA